MKKAIFLDRHGIINKKAKEHEYITSWEKFEFLPGVLKSLKKLSKTDYKIIIITNQRGIACRKMSVNDLKEIHKKMVSKIKSEKGRIDKIYFCPHNIGECNCRKPLPGLIDRASKEIGINLKQSWVIGDSLLDIQLGKSRKCKTIYIGKEIGQNIFADHAVRNLEEATNIILFHKF